ncbi:PKD domain-containing protein [Myxococcus stipitatus]|uniref:carboxylesterase family protein n=1 Tax=Myxococcus stipitatus TaxID=83455 RepID=UPI0030D00403
MRWGAAALVLVASGCEGPVEVGQESEVSSVAAPLLAQRIIITPAMVQPDGVRPTLGAYQNLFDEQSLVGDPKGPLTFKPATTWGNVAYNESQYPMGFVIDLGQLYDVTEVGVFDTFETGKVFIGVGAPGAWTSVEEVSTNLWEKWNFKTIGKRTRYIHFARDMKGASNEIVIYGSPVGNAPNVPPTVSAGADQTVLLPTTSAVLAGAAVDSDGTLVSRQWTQVSGPNTATLTGATTLSATASGLVVGLYEFELTVTDDDGATASSRTKVTVQSAAGGRGTTQEIYKVSTTPGQYGYVLYLPPGYEAGSNWPVVFFLHGGGEGGSGLSGDLHKVRNHGPQRFIDQDGKDYPFVLVSPQTSGGWSEYEAVHNLDPFIMHILATLKVNPKRVYLTGLSMGGSGTFNYATLFPEKLAAAVSVCNGGYNSNLPAAQVMVRENLHLWAVHAADDIPAKPSATIGWFDKLGQAMGGTGGVMDTYSNNPSRVQTAHFRPDLGRWQWVDGQVATDANGLPPPKPMLFTYLPSGGHEIWNAFYSDPKVFTWMLAQQRP